MPPHVLYQRLCHQLLVCVPTMGVWPRRLLALLVTVVLLARHTALPRMAAQLRRVIRTAHADSIERRLRRTLADTQLRERAGIRACSQSVSAQAGDRALPAAPGRYAANDALHAEYSGLGVWRTRLATRVVP